MSENKALANIEQYAAVVSSPEDVKEAIETNLGDEPVRVFDFDRVKVPPGGGVQWAIETLSGEEEYTKEISGVIVHMQRQRVFWPHGIDEGSGEPPDCRSIDAKTGVGAPGGICGDCPNNKWESATKGRGKACKEIRLVFLLQPHSLLPVIISFPPTSLKTMNKFLTKLTGRGIPVTQCITTLRLEKEKNDDGVDYSHIIPSAEKITDPAALKALESYRASMVPQIVAGIKEASQAGLDDNNFSLNTDTPDSYSEDPFDKE